MTNQTTQHQSKDELDKVIATISNSVILAMTADTEGKARYRDDQIFPKGRKVIEAYTNAKLRQAIEGLMEQLQLDIMALTHAEPHPKWGKHRQNGFVEGARYVGSRIKAYFKDKMPKETETPEDYLKRLGNN